MPITHEELKRILEYDERTGIFTWKKNCGARSLIGGIAGSMAGNGYIYISISRKKYLAHRLAWLYIFNSLPTGNIDHIDGNKLNNSISNLRDISQRLNTLNSSKVNNFGGNIRTKNSKYEVYLTIDYTIKYYGVYNTIEKALLIRDYVISFIEESITPPTLPEIYKIIEDIY